MSMQDSVAIARSVPSYLESSGPAGGCAHVLLCVFTAWSAAWRTARDEHAAELDRAVQAAAAWRSKLRRLKTVVDDGSSASTGVESGVESSDSQGHSSGSEDDAKVPAKAELPSLTLPHDCGPYLRGRLSCLMAKVLRHSAASLGLHLGADGFVPVADLLALPPFVEIDVQLRDVLCVVAFELREGKKQRFMMRDGANGPEIRANQGHSAAAVDGQQVTRATKAGDLPALVVHGTYLKHMRQIFTEGLRPMGRHHIHLFLEDGGVGRKGAELLVYVDVERACAAGVTFLISENGVILTNGGPGGSIPPACFAKVLRTKDGAVLHDSSSGEVPKLPAMVYVPPHSRGGTVPTSAEQAPKYRPPQRRQAAGAADANTAGAEPRWAPRRR